MAAALQQYQACLGIMVRLQVEDLTALKRDFDAAGARGLALPEFVSVMLDRVSAWDAASAVQFIQDLVELYAQVDVNGDGTMEWEEFTSAIIEGGMGTMSDELDWRDLQYEEAAGFADILNRPPKRVQYLPEFKRLLVYDNTRPVIEIVEPSALYAQPSDAGANDKVDGDANGSSAADPQTDSSSGIGGFTPTLSIANKFHPLCYIAGYRRDQDDVRSERSPVQALKYLSKVDLLAVSGGDLKLTFWASTILTASSTSALETPLPLAIVHTPRPQRVLEWEPTTQHLFSISADLVISVWLVVRERLLDAKGRCEVSLLTTLKQHTDLLQDLLLLNSETLVTCGMDSMIYLWDTTTLQVRACRQGHRRGVRSLTKLSSQLFLSAGFECEVLGWDISSLAVEPVFKLWGHNAPVCCIQLIQSAALAGHHERRASLVLDKPDANDAAAGGGLLGDQAITVDDDGWFKWWNLANITSMENNDLEQNSSRCLQTFRLGSGKYPWRAHGLAVLNGGQTLLAAGLHKLKLLQRVRLKPRLLPSSAVLYNAVSFTLLTTTDREIRVWDATSGALLRTFRNIATSDITCVDLDARQRKIVVGTQRGELVVLNYMNGAILKSWTPHQLTVSTLIYCKEDQCVLTASWDRSLRLYDDNTSANALLRCITDAHDADIKCMAYSYAMSLVATGSADGVVKIWDYVYFLLEDMCSLAALGLPQTDVSALEFVEPYPLLVSCHENGLVCCWSVSPTQASALLFYYAPFLRDPATVDTGLSPPPAAIALTDDENKGGICCCQVFYDESGGELVASDIRKGRFLLISASLDGEICVDDLSLAISRSGIKAFRAESLPSNHGGSYNPRRRFIRHGKSAKRLKNHLKSHRSGVDATRADASGDAEHGPAVTGSDVSQVGRWRAHASVVRSLRIVDEPQTILTCSSDKSVRLWSLEGECVGTLVGSQPPATGTGTGTDAGANAAGSGGAAAGAAAWSWSVDVATAARFKREQAEEIWEAMKLQKLKVLEARKQSMKLIMRQRHRNSRGLGTTLISAANLQPPQVSGSFDLLTNQEELNDPKGLADNTTNRLFKQLKGEATWKQSDFQLARQDAWERERDKFHQRMKRILKKKAQSAASDAARDEEDDVHNSNNNSGQDATIMECFSEVLDSNRTDAALDPAANLLPESLGSSVQELPFDDKDNWSVGGLNRQRQMYGNFHHETVRRSQKVVAKGSKLRRMQSAANIDLTPSTFLLEKLGTSCVIQENPDSAVFKPVQDAKKKRLPATRLTQSQSMGTLPVSRSNALNSHASASVSALEDLPPPPTSERMMPVAHQVEAAPELLHHVGSAPALVARASTIKDLFLETRVVEKKAQRTTRLLTRTSSMRAEKLLAPLQEAGAPTRNAEASTQTSKSRRNTSFGRPSSSGTKPRMSAHVNDGASAKKQRIRSDTAIMRQDYFGNYSRDDVVNLYRTFNMIDKDKSGAITLRELIDGAGLFGSTHLRENLMSIFSSIDKDQSGQVDLKELCGAVFSEAPSEVMHDILHFCALLDSAEKAKKMKKKKLTTDQLNELKQLFRLYDTDRNGNIDVDELFNALGYNARFYDDEGQSRSGSGSAGSSSRRRGSDAASSAPHITRDDVVRIIARFDTDTNSTLDLHEFIELFREEL